MIEEILALLNKDEGINADDILRFTNVKPATINKDGSFTVEKNKITLSTGIILKAGDVKNLDVEVETTIGRAIVNRILKIDPFGNRYKFDNKPFNINKFIDEVTVSLMSGDVTPVQMAKLIDNAIWLTRFADMVLPSLSERIIVTPKHTKALRESLVKENQEMIDNGDVAFVGKLDLVTKDMINELKDDPSFMLYSLGKPSAGNNLKQMIGSFSPIYDVTTGKYCYPKGNLMEGLCPEDYNLWANMNISGTYDRAVDTQDGGSIVKSLYGSMHAINAGPDGSDCGSTMYKTIFLNDSNIKMYMWNYLVEGSRLILLTPDNAKMYLGKKVSFRSALFCKYDSKFEICNKCCGEVPYRTNLRSIGSLTARVGFNFVKLSLKSFHDNTISLNDINPFEFMKIV